MSKVYADPEPHVEDAHSSAGRKFHDWTRDIPQANCTPFQDFTRNVNWEKSPLGPMRLWPDQLRQMVNLIMADPSPAVVYWGDPDNLAIVYNEAYVPLIGQKHPQLQGQDPSVGFAEIWPRFDKIIREGQETGLAHVGGRQFLLLQRYGFLEETYFSWKFVPMIGPEGYVVASHATVVEVTREVISDRRTKSIQSLNQHLAAANQLSDFWPHLLDGIKSNEEDCPLVLLYSMQNEERETSALSRPRRLPCMLEGTLGVRAGHFCAPEHLDLERGSEGFELAMRESWKTGMPRLLQVKDGSLPQRLLEGLDWRGYGVPSTEIIVCPIHSHSSRIAGFIIIGLNPRKPYDADYSNYINQITEQVARPYCASLTLGEEVKRGEDIARNAAIERAELSNQLFLRTKDYEQSEMKFSRFADRAAVGLSIVDTDGQLLYANDAWYDFAGMSPGSNEPMSWVDSVIQEDKSVIEHWWSTVLHQKSSGMFQVRSKKPFKGYSERSGYMQAEHSTGLCAAYPDLDDSGNVKTVMGLIMDISERKWIEDQMLIRTKQVELEELKYRQFADHAPLGVCLIDSQGFMEFANDAWYSISAQSRQEMDVAAWIEDTVRPDDRKKMAKFFSDLNACRGPLTAECRLQKSVSIDGGPQIPACVLASGYTELKMDGTFKNVICWVTDISAQKAAARELRNKMEEALELKKQQENFIDMISHEIRNPLSAILHCSEEIITTSSKYISQSDATALSSEYRLPSELVESVLLFDHLRDISDAAQTVSYCCQHQKRIVDDVLTLSKLDSDLLVLSPVAVLPAKVAKDAIQIFESEMKAADIEFELREDVSLKELDMNWIYIDPSRVQQVLINLLANAIKFTRDQPRRLITVRLSASRTRPSEDAGRIDYLPRRTKAKMTNVASSIASDEQLYLSFSVADTGQGLSGDEKQVLFGRFAQGSPKTHVKYGGSGLGLYISRQITEMQGGEIGVASERGKGSIFTFYVKTERVPKPRQERPAGVRRISSTKSTSTVHRQSAKKGAPRDSAVAKNSAVSRLGLRILIVEDNLVNQRVLSKQLRMRGFETNVANHGREALDALLMTHKVEVQDERQSYDLILLDIEMPVMGGLECIREIRRLEADGKLLGHVPVIAVTANAREEHVKAAIEAGMDLVTTKPYRIDHLISQIELAIGESDAEASE